MRGILLGLICITVLTLGCSRKSDQATKKHTAPEVQGKNNSSSLSQASVFPAFVDVTDQAKIDFQHHFINSESGEIYQINPYDHGSGLCIVDINGDGLDDIYFLDFVGENKLYLNKGGFQFEDISANSGIRMERVISVGGAFGDYDNDGDQDLYVTTYRGGNKLFCNRGNGVFDDVTEVTKTGYDGHSSGVIWFDYDGDGDLDLYVSNIGKFTEDTINNQANYYRGLNLMAPIIAMNRQPDNVNLGEPNILWRNDGNNKFVDVSAESGLNTPGWNGDATVSDYDGDGDPDVFVANMFGTDSLYQNDGKGHFVDVTEKALGATSWGSVGCKFFDANGDGKMDLFVVDMHSDMWTQPDDLAKIVERRKYSTPWGARFAESPILGSLLTTPTQRMIFGNTFFINKGDGTFTESSDKANLETWWPWAVTNADLDNDGDEDVYIPSGMGFPFFYWPNSLFINDGTGTFTSSAEECKMEPPRDGVVVKGIDIGGIPFSRSSRSAATSDLDQDGDLDLVVANFNARPYVFRNDLATNQSSSIRVKLQGNTCNRDAIGARVFLVTDQRRILRECVNTGGYLTQSSSTLHFGMGTTEKPEQIEVYWPWSKEPQVVKDIKIGQPIVIRQP